MLLKRIALGAVASAMATTPALAQQPQKGTVEIGAFGQYTEFDSRFRLDNAIGFGGRLGVFFSPRWALEGEFGRASISANGEGDAPGAAPRPCPTAGVCPSDWNFTPLYLRLAYNIPVARRSQVVLGAHVVRLGYDFDHETGFGGLAGVRAGISPSLSVRLDGLVDYNKNDVAGLDDDTDWTLTGRAGLSLMLNTSKPAPPPPAPVVVVTPPPAPTPPAPAPVTVVVVDTAAIRLQVSNLMAERIYFDFDAADLRPEARATLDAKIPLFNANPDMRIRIAGNADERGSDEYNLALGQRRAQSAKAYLVQRGIDANRIDITSNGEEQPVCEANTDACYQQNRRDDFQIIAGGPLFRMP